MKLSDIQEFVKRGQAAQEAVDRLTLATVWVARGEGSTWRELFGAFEPATHLNTWTCYHGPHATPEVGKMLDSKTNLLLTGSPLTQTDRERWQSGNVA